MSFHSNPYCRHSEQGNAYLIQCCHPFEVPLFLQFEYLKLLSDAMGLNWTVSCRAVAKCVLRNGGVIGRETGARERQARAGQESARSLRSGSWCMVDVWWTTGYKLYPILTGLHPYRLESGRRMSLKCFLYVIERFVAYNPNLCPKKCHELHPILFNP
jgi:hypothetical protein